jgi:hypothetical protein
LTAFSRQRDMDAFSFSSVMLNFRITFFTLIWDEQSWFFFSSTCPLFTLIYFFGISIARMRAIDVPFCLWQRSKDVKKALSDLLDFSLLFWFFANYFFLFLFLLETDGLYLVCCM